MLYTIRETEYKSNCIENILDRCIEEDYHEDDDDDFRYWVNDCYDSVSVAGYDYSAYDVLAAFEDLGDLLETYKEECNDSDRENGEYELSRANDGDIVYIQRYTVLCEDEDEDAGDTDGDANIEFFREKMARDKIVAEQEQILDEQRQQTYLDLFQTIGG